MRRLVVLALLLAGCAGGGDPEPPGPTPLRREIRPTAADFFAGRDPVLARALALP